jgi:hypothetical protein
MAWALATLLIREPMRRVTEDSPEAIAATGGRA